MRTAEALGIVQVTDTARFAQAFGGRRRPRSIISLWQRIDAASTAHLPDNSAD